MPRSKALMKKRAGAGTSTTGTKKIVIKPFRKPPTLPPAYYETTSQELLEGTLLVIFGSNNDNGSLLSLQNSYQQVVNLVSHQFGPKLYQDLVQNFAKACEQYVLPSLSGNHHHAGGGGDLMQHVQTQYQKYVDFLLLCKHVFLPLDRTHAWTAAGADG